MSRVYSPGTCRKSRFSATSCRSLPSHPPQYRPPGAHLPSPESGIRHLTLRAHSPSCGRVTGQTCQASVRRDASRPRRTRATSSSAVSMAIDDVRALAHGGRPMPCAVRCHEGVGLPEEGGQASDGLSRSRGSRSDAGFEPFFHLTMQWEQLYRRLDRNSPESAAARRSPSSRVKA